MKIASFATTDLGWDHHKADSSDVPMPARHNTFSRGIRRQLPNRPLPIGSLAGVTQSTKVAHPSSAVQWPPAVTCTLFCDPFAESLTEGAISPDMSACGAGSTEIPAGPVPTQSDHSPRCGNAVCSPNTAPSFARRRAPEGTESAPAHRRPDDKGGRKSSADRAARETGSHSLLLSVSRHPK